MQFPCLASRGYRCVEEGGRGSPHRREADTKSRCECRRCSPAPRIGYRAPPVDGKTRSRPYYALAVPLFLGVEKVRGLCRWDHGHGGLGDGNTVKIPGKPWIRPRGIPSRVPMGLTGTGSSIHEEKLPLRGTTDRAAPGCRDVRKFRPGGNVFVGISEDRVVHFPADRTLIFFIHDQDPR